MCTLQILTCCVLESLEFSAERKEPKSCVCCKLCVHQGIKPSFGKWVWEHVANHVTCLVNRWLSQPSVPPLSGLSETSIKITCCDCQPRHVVHFPEALSEECNLFMNLPNLLILLKGIMGAELKWGECMHRSVTQHVSFVDLRWKSYYYLSI